MVGVKKIGVLFASALLALAMLPASFAQAGGPPATFTTVNTGVDGVGHCKNGPPDATTVVNCNIYDGKAFVWLNGGPDNAALADGTYFFAVLVPGGQPDPNDGGAKNLSDTTAAPWASGSLNADGSAIPIGDARSNRTFTVSGGVITYTGTHTFDSNMIRLMPYDDTTNEGGVYILAICKLSSADAAVNPRDCKYDAFKVQEEEQRNPPLDAPTGLKTAFGSFDRTFTWKVEKSVDQTRINQSGTTATFNYTVTVTQLSHTDSNFSVGGTIFVVNPNPVSLTGITVTDAIPGATCNVTGGVDQTVSPGATGFDYTCTGGGWKAGDTGTNTATITWPEQTVDGFTTLAAGSDSSLTATFSFDTPNLKDDCVAVSDSLQGSLGTVCSTETSPATFLYSRIVTGSAGTCTSVDNTASFTTNTSGTIGDSNIVTVKLCVGADLTVAKTAAPAFKRTYNWAITKDVDKTLVEQFGGTATFNYTINVNETGFVDSDWMVTGTITITNPNNWEAITANVADAIDNGGSCSITGGGVGVSVPAGGSVPLTYTCTYTSATSTPPDGTNTATATWDMTAFFTPTGSASGTAAVSFNTAPTSTVNKTITVTDTFNSVTITLGTLTATDARPFTSATYLDSRPVNVPASNCIRYTNTALIVETGQLAQRTVEVCGPAASGALTMGFWQNKNGQGIINSATQANLSAFLKGYHPFSDLSGPITTYVTNVIKSANASGSSMNAMLKAQMLATALDVYFSDPANGNPIKAPAPIGNITIDLTKICQMIDGSGGTATCSGTFENVSSAFGGATSMTVSNMLLYQNTSDPAVDAGAAWYGQVKATQQLAKDAFDAINNQVAFAP